jgi:hypothetical protein
MSSDEARFVKQTAGFRLIASVSDLRHGQRLFIFPSPGTLVADDKGRHAGENCPRRLCGGSSPFFGGISGIRISSVSWANLMDTRAQKLARFGEVDPRLSQELNPDVERLAYLAFSLANLM